MTNTVLWGFSSRSQGDTCLVEKVPGKLEGWEHSSDIVQLAYGAELESQSGPHSLVQWILLHLQVDNSFTKNVN